MINSQMLRELPEYSGKFLDEKASREVFEPQPTSSLRTQPQSYESRAAQILENLQFCETRALKFLEGLQSIKTHEETKNNSTKDPLDQLITRMDRRSAEIQEMKEDLDLIKKELVQNRTQSLEESQRQEFERSLPLSLAEKVKITAFLIAPMLLPALGRGLAASLNMDANTTFLRELGRGNIVDITASVIQLSQIFYHGFRAGLPGIQEFAEKVMPQQIIWIAATAFWHMEVMRKTPGGYNFFDEIANRV